MTESTLKVSDSIVIIMNLGEMNAVRAPYPQDSVPGGGDVQRACDFAGHRPLVPAATGPLPTQALGEGCKPHIARRAS